MTKMKNSGSFEALVMVMVVTLVALLLSNGHGSDALKMTSSTTTATTKVALPTLYDELFTRIVGNLVDGLLGGFFEELRGNYTVFGVGLEGCIQKGLNNRSPLFLSPHSSKRS